MDRNRWSSRISLDTEPQKSDPTRQQQLPGVCLRLPSWKTPMPLKAFTSDFSTTSVCVIEQSPVKSQIANHTQAKYSHTFKKYFLYIRFFAIPLRYICSDLIKYINFSVCWSSDLLSSWPICYPLWKYYHSEHGADSFDLPNSNP